MKLLIVIFLTCFSLSAFTQSKKEKKQIKMWGIKSVTETVTEVVNSKEVTRKDSYSVYDKNANRTYYEEYRKDGTLRNKESVKYDSKGNTLEETVFSGSGSQQEKNYKKTYKYDSDGNKTEESEFDSQNKFLKKIVYNYNPNGEKTGEVEYDSENKIVKKTVYAYDSKGLRSAKKEVDAANNVISTRLYKYEFKSE